MAIPCGTLTQTLNVSDLFAILRLHTLIVGGVDSLVRPTIVASYYYYYYYYHYYKR